jgi:drug/metabolite transporter (DMT)-like permease
VTGAFDIVSATEMTTERGERAAGGQIRRGVGLAALAALLFGMTAPLLKRASAGLGPLASGSLLYLGAAAGALVMAAARHRQPGRRRVALPRASLGRIALVALIGGAVAPGLLVTGLRRIDAASGALLLALEAPFTLVLARLLLGERIGARVAVAALLISLGGAALIGGARVSQGGAAGAVLVAAAALAWAADNLLSRALADHDPLGVVAAKGLLGGLASAAAALAFGEAAPAPAEVAALLAIGAIGYGVSLRLYLGAQRIVGAARTASVFAAAPLAGVAAAFALGAPWPGPALPIAVALVGAGLALHASERHSHLHRHDALAHEHLHRHDDGHHDHRHDPMPEGPHSHFHRHEETTHAHEHGEDLHHRHAHPHAEHTEEKTR